MQQVVIVERIHMQLPHAMNVFMTGATVKARGPRKEVTAVRAVKMKQPLVYSLCLYAMLLILLLLS